MNSDYKEINKALWNHRTEQHIHSDFYDLESFKNGRNSLDDIVLNLLGDVAGKKVLHLQCHFGQDTLSIARMGADVTGVDLSDSSIEKANQLSDEIGEIARFICCDVYDIPQHLEEEFDIVFTSYGTIGWLPDIQKWASIVSKYLKPGGKFVFAEFHPVVWMFDNNFDKIEYRYFNSEPIIETETKSYAGAENKTERKSISWNHGIGDVVTALLAKGISIESLKEYDYSPYDCFSGTIEFEPGKFRIEKLRDKIPMVYSLVAVK